MNMNIAAGCISSRQAATSYARVNPSLQSPKRPRLDLPDASAPHPGGEHQWRLWSRQHGFSRLKGICPNYHYNFLPDYRAAEHVGVFAEVAEDLQRARLRSGEDGMQTGRLATQVSGRNLPYPPATVVKKAFQLLFELLVSFPPWRLLAVQNSRPSPRYVASIKKLEFMPIDDWRNPPGRYHLAKQLNTAKDVCRFISAVTQLYVGQRRKTRAFLFWGTRFHSYPYSIWSLG